MVAARAERRLAAILAADMVGYSRLMEVDEADTMARHNAHFKDLVLPQIADHNGRVIKTTGDGLLAEFPSVVDAVDAAVAIQRGMATRNKDVPPDRRIDFRIGVHLGDVMVEDDELYGDGVNIAARLEGLADAGGVCISQQAFDQVEMKLKVPFDDLGEHSLKNISRPVRVWRWRLECEGLAGPASGISMPAAKTDKPSIAVLPFENMSGDPEQDYFADGVTEEILTLLARDRWLTVIARNSTFTYKGKSVDVRDVSRALNAHYVLEGSVRKAGDRVRITAQLIDGMGGGHLWSERYDRKLEDIFAVQDEIAGAIAGAIGPELGAAERSRARRKPPQDLDAWDLCWQGLWHYYKFADENLAEAQSLFEQALSIDPEFAQALTCLAYVLVEQSVFDNERAQEELLARAITTAKRAIALDERDAWAHYVLGRALADSLLYEEAIAEFERAIELNPNFAQAYFGLGYTLVWCQREREGIELLAKAERLSPNDPELWHFYDMRSTGHLSLGELDEAERYTRKALRQPNCTFWPYVMLPAILGLQGRTDEARQAAGKLFERRPNYTCGQCRQDLYFCGNQTFIDTFVDGLKQAGIPD